MKVAVLILAFLISIPLYSFEMTLKGRTISDQCTYIYHLETDFEVEVLASELGPHPVLKYSFTNAYTGQSSEQEEVSLIQVEDQKWRVDFNEVTFSNRERFLYHQMRLEFQGIILRTSIMGLRHRCYPGGRAQTPFEFLILE